ncbi:E3 ubiquitin-protein ligase RNF182-like [Rhineura floridana]|uniref:E3 ubiquitin-protein ligase RNF182-like n=1 Tax=Rhineura floridana TaxID=261503 RepID=UPI002AC83A96|nr:E3 ubiquitin-protein ligase RNF182-like [Rhineura floridana]XP_061486695.1 E3 ubiquitin-protein ligase RNF182-like [Rhineura floridana]XP_061486696.1 E3 ubiquitin-protein ligase RNF182-like [Rhineura floridana]XP_061486697.1 E3 ubiquitin-protein ligase RNF182-like [Rhineura floridana]XP_061486698.1 E3 ubiquitin-protein ligase RNF182-like [Rhineura floridana]
MSLPIGKAGGSQPLVFTAPEMECKICYERFDGRSRRPKLLSCRHRMCTRCLRKMVDVGESPGCLSCPFCRQEMLLPDKDVGQLQDDGQVLALLSCRERARKQGGPAPEVLLCPSILEPFAGGKHSSSSDCLVITLLEMPEDMAAPEGVGVLDVMRLYRPPSVASLPCPASLDKCLPCPAWRAFPRFLLGVLCLVYFSSLPFGIYLLLVKRLNLGIILVSLVPSTLILCVFYSLCQCLCHEIFSFPS